MNTKYSETQKIVFDIEKLSLSLATKMGSSKPMFIILKTVLFENLLNEGFIEEKRMILNGRYNVIVSDLIQEDWYLLFK